MMAHHTPTVHVRHVEPRVLANVTATETETETGTETETETETMAAAEMTTVAEMMTATEMMIAAPADLVQVEVQGAAPALAAAMHTMTMVMMASVPSQLALHGLKPSSEQQRKLTL